MAKQFDGRRFYTMPGVQTVLARAGEASHAFQPIISTSTMRTHGVEALARLPGAADGAAVLALLDEAVAHQAILDAERVLLAKAMRTFAEARLPESTRLFCNVDNRVFQHARPDFDQLDRAIRQAGLSHRQICWEISERDAIELDEAASDFLRQITKSDVRIALDDFGTKDSNLERLLVIEPHYVKIDRCFIHGLAGNQRKLAIVSKLCGMAHALGYATVAEGIETEDDFRAAREVGCDYAQGYLIARPCASLGAIRQDYGRSLLTVRRPQVSSRVEELLTQMPPIRVDAALSEAAERFHADRDLVLLPVVDRDKVVLGAVFERDIRQVLLSDYGRELLQNRGAPTQVESSLKRCPVADLNASVEAIINSYVAAEGAAGLVLLADGRYAGYLSNTALLRLASESEISQAREQNPLTRLPGNQSIERCIGSVIAGRDPVTLAVIDFDFFKAFNDRYGFAAGDRLLQMFADLLRQLQRQAGAFVGHIGGDDFFVSLPLDGPEAVTQISELCSRFSSDASSLYSAKDRAAGGIRGRDRFGAKRFFPLLRASAGVLHLPTDRGAIDPQMIEERLTSLKTSAKASPAGIACGFLESGAPSLLRRLESRLRAAG